MDTPADNFRTPDTHVTSRRRASRQPSLAETPKTSHTTWATPATSAPKPDDVEEEERPSSNGARGRSCPPNAQLPLVETPTVSEFTGMQQDLLKSERRYKKALQDVVYEQGRIQDLTRELEASKHRVTELCEEVRLKDELIKSKDERVQRLVDQVDVMKSEASAARLHITSKDATIREAERRNTTLQSRIIELEKEITRYKNELCQAIHDEKHRAVEYRHTEGLLAKKETELAVRRSLDVGLTQMNRVFEDHLAKQLTSFIHNAMATAPNTANQNMEIAKLGSLSTMNEFLMNQVGELKRREEELTGLLDSARETAQQAGQDRDNLQSRMLALEGDSQRTNMYLIEENDKIKCDRAAIRCELLAKRREIKKLEEQLAMQQLNNGSQAKIDEMDEKLRLIETERDSLKLRLESLESAHKEAESMIAELKEKLKDKEEDSDLLAPLRSERDHCKRLLEKETEKCKVLNRGLGTLDEQIRMVEKQRDRYKERLNEAHAENTRIRQQVMELETRVDGLRRAEAEISEVMSENERLVNKVSHLQEELRETHFDYREEMARMARDYSEQSAVRTSADASAENLQLKVTELTKSHNETETQLRAAKRQIEELHQKIAQLTRTVNDTKAREALTNDENARFKIGLVEAIEKAEKFKKEAADAVENLTQQSEEFRSLLDKVRVCETELNDMEDVVKEKEKIIAYLKSQTNAQKMPKLKSRSTLLHHPSDSSIEMESAELEILEGVRRNIQANLAEKRQELNKRKGSSSDIENLQGSDEVSIPTQRSPFKRPLAPVNGSASSSGDEYSGVVKPSVGMMRHDIPHSWRQQIGLAVRQLKCAMCFEGIPRMGYAMRCNICEVVVHRRCTRRVNNTCGMPAQYAEYYHDCQEKVVRKAMGSSSKSMNGWVRVYSTREPKWLSSFAVLDKGRLSFFDKEPLAGQLDNPRLRLELDNKAWSVRFLGEGPNGERDGDFNNCIQIRHQGEVIHIMCPTDSATAHWMGSLQAASKDRHFMTRSPSAFANNSLVLALDTPQNLNVNAVNVFDDWLLIAAQEGLFATPIADPRNPFPLFCSGAFHSVLYIKDVDVVVTVSNQNRQLGLISASELRIQLNQPRPTVHLQNLPGIEYAHMIEYHQEGQQKYLLVADANSIHILQQKRDFFAPCLKLELDEPATCMLSAHGGIYYGSDKYYHATMLYSGKPKIVALTEEHMADYPMAVLETGDDEVLLAYQNHGIFVNSRGERTRNSIVEWELTPMEFAYSKPYLFVVHCDSLEIMQVYENEGLNSRTVSEERDVYNTKQAHIVGNGPSDEVLVTISSSQRMELHSFGVKSGKRGGSKRRAITNAFGSFEKKIRPAI